MMLQSLRGDRFALQGVYSRGVQIVGLLETRGIGFRSVFVPSFNEGHFPKTRENDILLPADIRDLFDLPTLLDREELEFYYLKRVVDRAPDVSFIALRDNRGETDVVSRYAHLFSRLEPGDGLRPRHTLPVWAPHHKQRRRDADRAAVETETQRFSRLDIARLKGCETQYYIASRLGIHEYEELGRGIEPALVGQRVHLIFNNLYRDMDYERLDPARLSQELDVLIDSHFEEGLFFSREEDLLKRVLRDKLHMSLRHDVSRFQSGYRVCPDYIEKTLEADLQGGRYTIWGRIDRVDTSPDGSFVLIDYKTGQIPRGKDHFEESEFSEVQLGFYGLLLKHAVPDAAIESLCYFDVSGDGSVKSVVGGKQMPGYLAGFETHLVEFLDRFNAKSELSLAADLATCTYCPFDVICRIGET
jgi:hypothetical protein